MKHTTTPKTQTYHDTYEDMQTIETEIVEAVYLRNSEGPRFIVDPDHVWESDNYLSVNITGDSEPGDLKEIYRIPHDRIRCRKRIETPVDQDEEQQSALEETANAEIITDGGTPRDGESYDRDGSIRPVPPGVESPTEMADDE